MKGAIFTMGSPLPPQCEQVAPSCDGDGTNICQYCEGVFCDDHMEDNGECWHCAGGDEGNYNGPT